MSTNAYVVRVQTTNQREWEMNGQNSYNKYTMVGVATTWEGARMLALTNFLADNFLADSVEDDKTISWDSEAFGYQLGTVTDGGYVSRYMIEFFKPVTVRDAAKMLDRAKEERKPIRKEA